MTDECEIYRDYKTTILVSLLKVSNLYAIPCHSYEYPIDQNWMYELCTFSQFQSNITASWSWAQMELRQDIDCTLCFSNSYS